LAWQKTLRHKVLALIIEKRPISVFVATLVYDLSYIYGCEWFKWEWNLLMFWL